ncbi:MAG: esterase-like activity of phytase family protein [Sulfurimonas sp.]
MKKVFNMLFLLFITLNAEVLNYTMTPHDFPLNQYMNIKILDTKELRFKPLKKIEFAEISDLAYKDERLFAVGDRGVLYELGISFNKDKIENISLLHVYNLEDEKTKKLSKKYRDSEGLAFVGNQLAISFERKNRVDLYTLNARKIKQLKINKKLQDKKDYTSINKGLESVAYNQKYGIITAPEKPLKNKKYHKIYAQNSFFKFKAKGVIKALEFIDENRILVLLRKFHKFTKERETILLSLDLRECKNSICQTKIIAKLNTSAGWKIDNFEGLTKISKNRFLMVSDDNGNVFQKTLLVFFEIVD